MKFPKFLISSLLLVSCFVGVYPEQAQNAEQEIVEQKVDNLKDQTLLARRLLLRFVQCSVDLINEQKAVFHKLVAIHDSTITSENKFSLRKQFTKKEWENSCGVKELEKYYDDFVKGLAISSDFLAYDSLDEESLRNQICFFAEKVSSFCSDVALSDFEFSDQEGLAGILFKIETAIFRIEKKVKKIQDDPTFIGRMKKVLWGSNFSYNVLPVLVTIALHISNYVVKTKRAKKAIRIGDIGAASALRDRELKAAANFGVAVSRDELIVLLGESFMGLYKWFQTDSYKEREFQKKQTFGLRSQRVKKVSGENVRFDDIVGYDDVKQQLQSVVESLVNPLKFKRIGVDVPKGVLLSGAPGTGKTLLARAISGESGCPCFIVNPSDLIEDNIKGRSATKKIDDLFAQAEASAPSIIFIDELDFIGGRKNKDGGRSTALANLLTKLNGFKARNPYRPVLIVAATNCPDDLDEALVRSGRFDIRIELKLAGAEQRHGLIQKELLSRYSGSNEDFDVERIVELTEGCSSADIVNIINNAFLKTAFKGVDFPTGDEFADATNEVKNRSVLQF